VKSAGQKLPKYIKIQNKTNKTAVGDNNMK
jgi:hypothetical protein